MIIDFKALQKTIKGSSVLKEALECPSKIYTFTAYAMEDAIEEFKDRNGEIPSNVFLKISDSCKLLNQ